MVKWYKLTVYWVSGDESHLYFRDEDFCEKMFEAFMAYSKVEGCVITEEVINEQRKKL